MAAPAAWPEPRRGELLSEIGQQGHSPVVLKTLVHGSIALLVFARTSTTSIFEISVFASRGNPRFPGHGGVHRRVSRRPASVPPGFQAWAEEAGSLQV